MEWIDNKFILTPTSGFLGTGYTHTLNAYSGCAFAGTTCGVYCYAQHNNWITEGRPWGFYGAKKNVVSCYRAEYDRIKRPRRGEPKPLKIYMSSSTDPYIPQEQRLGLTRSLLEAMVDRPPDVLVLQTHTTLIERDFDVIESVAERSKVWVSITVETDMDKLPPGFPPAASLPSRRLETLKQFRDRGISTQATVSPLMPLANPEAFAVRLDEACVRVILDHFLIGDGSKNGLRTKRTGFIELLGATGFGEWAHLEKLWEIRNVMTDILGEARVLVSCEGFNAV